MNKTLLLLAIGLFIHKISLAQEEDFAYTYQTFVLPKGTLDLEYFNTLRLGKTGANSPYIFGRQLDQRLELETGLGKNVQTSFYFNASSFSFADSTSPDVQHQTGIGFSNEWKWKISDPVSNSLGSALYAEVSASSNELELEGKLILDKIIKQELFAFNAGVEYELETELENEEGELHKDVEWETPFEFDFAYMHLFKPSFGLGAEVRNVNNISEDGGWEYSVLYAGPTLHFTAERFFMNLNVSPQLLNLHKSEFANANLELTDNERANVRVYVGYSF